MNCRSDSSEIIKSALTMPQVAERYGFPPNRSGYIRCPFHDEKTPSLRMKEKYWKCYGCGKGGTVIDFVMQLFEINFTQALVRLNHDFSLNLSMDKPDARAIDDLKRRQAERAQAVKQHHSEYDRLCGEYKRLWRAFVDKAPKSPDDPISDEYAEALRRLPYLDYWFLHNTYDSR